MKENTLLIIKYIYGTAVNSNRNRFCLQVLPDYLSQWTTEKVRKEGVTVRANTTIRDAIITPESRLLLLTAEGEEIVVDHAVVAVGLEPNTDLAKSSGLELDDKFGGFRDDGFSFFTCELLLQICARLMLERQTSKTIPHTHFDFAILLDYGDYLMNEMSAVVGENVPR